MTVTFRWDDGRAWGFQVGDEEVVWDHSASHFWRVPDGWSQIARQQLAQKFATLRGTPTGWALTKVEQTTIDLVALELQDALSITGRRLRHALQITPEEFDAIGRNLVPRYLVPHQGDKGDYYQLTLAGLLRSSEKRRVDQILLATIALLRAKFAVDPDVATYSTEEVFASGSIDPEEGGFVGAVVTAAMLIHGGQGRGQGRTLRMSYGVPRDVERLVRCAAVADFLGLLRAGHHDDIASPTAPIRSVQSIATAAQASGVNRRILEEPLMKYDVTLSFAGEDRQHAEALAGLLRTAGVTVFYDRDEQAVLWGKDLYEHLHSIYSEQATFCVIFVSAHYAKKLWTTHERKAAQERAFKERGGEYILPIRLDETRLPGLSDTLGYVSIRDGIAKIGEMLLAKVRGNQPGPVPKGITIPARPNASAADGRRWLEPSATLPAPTHGPARGIAWQFTIDPGVRFEGTKAELHEALTSAVVTYDLQDYGRAARWPRVLVVPEANLRTLGDGAVHWSHEYRDETDQAGDEQLLLSREGRVQFQRDTLSNIAEPAIDFGLLAHDVIHAVVFATRFAAGMGVAGEVTLTVGLQAPTESRPGLATFHRNQVDCEWVGHAAKLPVGRSDVGGAMRFRSTSGETVEGIATTAKRLLDLVANEFEHDTSGSGPGRTPFMAISAATVLKQVIALGLKLPDRPVSPGLARPLPELSVRYTTKSMDRNAGGTVTVHHYELVVSLKNTTSERLDDWYVEAELPTLLLEPHASYGPALLKDRSDAKRSLFRTSTALPPLPSGDTHDLRIPYRVDDVIYDDHGTALEQATATARVFVGGRKIDEKSLTKIENF